MNTIFIATPEHLVYQFCILDCRFNELRLEAARVSEVQMGKFEYSRLQRHPPK